MDFWDHLTLVTLITVRDYYHDKEKQKQKIGKIYEKCKEEIACAASDLFKKMTPIRIVSYGRADRTAIGHQQTVTYIFSLRA